MELRHEGFPREDAHRKRSSRRGRSPTWLPVGSTRVSADGYLQRKISDTGYPRDWKSIHILLWEEHVGPIPTGHCVCFKDNNKQNVVIDNLELITRAERMRRNSIHRYPPELKSAIRVISKLKRTIQEVEHENKIEDLRNHLFATIEGLLDEEKPLDIERAKAVAHVSSVIIESAKVEVKALEIIGAPGSSGSTFLQIGQEDSK